MVEDISLSRMIIGTNWLAGWSHTSASADAMIRERHADPKTIVPILETFLDAGVDTLMGPVGALPVIVRAVREAEQKTGKGIILIDTPIIDVDDSAEARKEAAEVIHKGRELGAKISLIHHSSAEKLVNKGKQTMDRQPDHSRGEKAGHDDQIHGCRQDDAVRRPEFLMGNDPRLRYGDSRML